MTRHLATATLLALAVLSAPLGARAAQTATVETRTVQVPGGEVALLFPVEGEDLAYVEAFELDVTPVPRRHHPEQAADRVADFGHVSFSTRGSS